MLTLNAQVWAISTNWFFFFFFGEGEIFITEATITTSRKLDVHCIP